MVRKMSREFDDQIKARARLAIANNKAINNLVKARIAADETKAAVIEYDGENPQVMFWVNKLAGDRKRAERGSTGTKVEAQGDASMAAVEGAGK